MVTPHGAEFVVPGQQRVGVVSDISHAEIVQHVAGGQAEVGNGHKQELADGRLYADKVLARHDENYMPPEVAQALEEAGYSPADFQAKAAEVGKRLEQEGSPEGSDY